MIRAALMMCVAANLCACDALKGDTQSGPMATQPDGAAGVAWTPPASWRKEAAKPMRAATYTIAGDAGEDGQCTVHFFGAGQGGAVDANLQRWVSQVEQPDGKPSADVAKVTSQTIAGLKVHRVDVAGTFLWSPSPMSPQKTPKPNWRMLGAIVEAPEGSVFFKFTAPAKVMDSHEGGFDAMLQSLRTSG